MATNAINEIVTVLANKSKFLTILLSSVMQPQNENQSNHENDQMLSTEKRE